MSVSNRPMVVFRAWDCSHSPQVSTRLARLRVLLRMQQLPCRPSPATIRGTLRRRLRRCPTTERRFPATFAASGSGWRWILAKSSPRPSTRTSRPSGSHGRTSSLTASTLPTGSSPADEAYHRRHAASARRRRVLRSPGAAFVPSAHRHHAAGAGPHRLLRAGRGRRWRARRGARHRADGAGHGRGQRDAAPPGRAVFTRVRRGRAGAQPHDGSSRGQPRRPRRPGVTLA